MRYAASTVLREDWLRYVRAGLGSFRAFELACGEPRVTVTGSELRELARLRGKEGLAYSVHAPFRRLDIASASRSLAAATEKLCSRSIEVAGEVGAEVVVVHPCMISSGEWDTLGGRDRAALKERELEAFRRLQKKARAAGVRIAVENMPRHRAARHISWLTELLGGLEPGVVGATVDVGHAQTCGIPPGMLLRELGTRVIHLHVHDNSGEGDQHRAVGEGSIDWRQVVEALVELDYQGLVADEALNLEGQQRGHERLRFLFDRAARVRYL